MLECECGELIKRGETFEHMELRISEAIREKEQLREDLKKKTVLTEREREFFENILPSEISCLRACRDNLQDKWASLAK